MTGKERRMPGAGSVYSVTVPRPGKTPLTRWIASYSVGPRGASKKHVRILRQSDMLRLSKNRTDAQAARACQRATERLLDALIADIRTGRTGHREPVTTLGDFLRGWHEVYANAVGSSQAASTGALIRQRVVPAIGSHAIGDIRAGEVERFLADLRRDLSSQSVRHVYNLLAVALDAAVRDELIPRNPVRLVKPPVVVKQPRQPWSFEEANRFLAATREDRYFAAYAVSLAVPIRQGELLGLPWSDVDLDGLTVRIRSQLQRRDGAYVMVATKTRRESAKAIDEDVAAVLRAHKARQDAERPFIPIEADGLVFVTEQGRPVNGSWLTHHFEKLAKAAGVRVVPFHAMRHSAASFMAAQDVHPRVAQDQGGWSSATVAMDGYTHTTTEQGRDAVRRVTRKLRVAG